MNQLRRLYLLIKEIGIADLVSYSLYQAQLRNGPTRQLTPPGGLPSFQAQFTESNQPAFDWKSNWDRLTDTKPILLMESEASLLKDGLYRPFYDKPQALAFKTSPQSNTHWIDVNEDSYDDIKMEWEPARFTWSLALAKAYRASNDETIIENFWQKFTEFNNNNPINTGPNWVSAQEAGIRAIMWILAVSAFRSSPYFSLDQMEMLATSIRHHVERVLPTLSYARSQHNNHILSESLCLILAGDFLSGIDPRAGDWCRVGERDFNRAILKQVDNMGTYSQHSANYHRMMLQLALLYDTRMRKKGRQLPERVQRKLSAASLWLIAQLDPDSGRLPNLGHNDGTLLLPFGCAEYRDYRPTAQAAAIRFLGKPCLPPGAWDELAIWLESETGRQDSSLEILHSPAVHKVGTADTWGTLRAVKFKNRPAHADQLHADLWWRGINIARDPGTYSYNMPHSWQNPFDRTRVHNTLTVNQLDQMVRVSRFLWLDHAQAKWKDSTGENIIEASHNGYRQLDISHQRVLQFIPGTGFLVRDIMTRLQNNGKAVDYCLHWLLPDWQWQLNGQALNLSDQSFSFRIEINGCTRGSDTPLLPLDISLIRAGDTITGQRHDEILGWESVTYGEKHPALSFSMRFNSQVSIELTTTWIIDEQIH